MADERVELALVESALPGRTRPRPFARVELVERRAGDERPAVGSAARAGKPVDRAEHGERVLERRLAERLRFARPARAQHRGDVVAGDLAEAQVVKSRLDVEPPWFLSSSTPCSARRPAAASDSASGTHSSFQNSPRVTSAATTRSPSSRPARIPRASLIAARSERAVESAPALAAVDVAEEDLVDDLAALRRAAVDVLGNALAAAAVV